MEYVKEMRELAKQVEQIEREKCLETITEMANCIMDLQARVAALEAKPNG